MEQVPRGLLLPNCGKYPAYLTPVRGLHPWSAHLSPGLPMHSRLGYSAQDCGRNEQNLDTFHVQAIKIVPWEQIRAPESQIILLEK